MHHILVVGAMSRLGQKVIDNLLSQGNNVRVWVDDDTSIAHLDLSVDVVRGNLVETDSFSNILRGIDTIIITMTGYTRTVKNTQMTEEAIIARNLIEAAQQSDVQQVIYTSVLNADQAESIPHYYQKKQIEDLIEQSGIPFVVLRPAGFIHELLRPEAVRRGRLNSNFRRDVRSSIVFVDDVAHFIIKSLDDERLIGKRISVASDEPVSYEEIAQILSGILNDKIKVDVPPRFFMNLMMSLGGMVNPMFREIRAMVDFVEAEKFIADTSLQSQYFTVRSTEDAIRKWVHAHNIPVR